MGIARLVKIDQKEPNPTLESRARLGFHVTIGKLKHIQNIDDIP
jgi:hypothetical protein